MKEFLIRLIGSAVASVLLVLFGYLCAAFIEMRSPFSFEDHTIGRICFLFFWMAAFIKKNMRGIEL